jgi:hypothetical protein
MDRDDERELERFREKAKMNQVMLTLLVLGGIFAFFLWILGLTYWS